MPEGIGISILLQAKLALNCNKIERPEKA